MRLSGRTAVVTGAAGGIGRAVAMEMAREGANVMMADLREDPLRQAVHELTAAGFAADGCATDVSTASGNRQLVDQALFIMMGCRPRDKNNVAKEVSTRLPQSPLALCRSKTLVARIRYQSCWPMYLNPQASPTRSMP